MMRRQIFMEPELDGRKQKGRKGECGVLREGRETTAGWNRERKSVSGR